MQVDMRFLNLVGVLARKQLGHGVLFWFGVIIWAWDKSSRLVDWAVKGFGHLGTWAWLQK